MSDEQHGGIHAFDLSYEVEGARLLDRVAMRGAPGELVGLIGPNGAGKSTLLRALAKVIRGQGEVMIDGRSQSRLSAGEIARQLALVGQQAPETFGFTAIEVVLTGRYPHLSRLAVEGPDDTAIALAAMSRTEVHEFSHRVTATLSGGERQRVFLARALAQQPRILLLDEPTASLDIRHQFAVFDLMRRLAQEDGVTVIVAVHDLRLAARYCDRLVLMADGRVVTDDTPAQVLRSAAFADAFGVWATVVVGPRGRCTRVDLEPVQQETRAAGEELER